MKYNKTCRTDMIFGHLTFTSFWCMIKVMKYAMKQSNALCCVKTTVKYETN